MTAVDHAKALYGLLSKLRARHAPPPVCKDGQCPLAAADTAAGEVEVKPLAPGVLSGCPIEACFHGDRVLREFVRSYLIWEASLARADGAMTRIAEAVVDINELRVCMPDEIEGILGPGYPRVEERVLRLRASLGDVFKREHCLKMDHLSEKPKREARAYLESLARVPVFVTARTALVALEAHAFPLDERLHAKLTKESACNGEHNADEAGAWLERTLKAGEAAEAYHLIQTWADDGAVSKGGKATRRKGSPAQQGKRPARKKSGR